MQPDGSAWRHFAVRYNRVPVGIVWDGDGCWHAARFSKANLAIAKPDRMEATRALIDLR
jgi:hypothetical protein